MRRSKRLNLRLYPNEVKTLRRIAKQVRISPTSWARAQVEAAIRRAQLAANPDAPVAA